MAASWNILRAYITAFTSPSLGFMHQQHFHWSCTYNAQSLHKILSHISTKKPKQDFPHSWLYNMYTEDWGLRLLADPVVYHSAFCVSMVSGCFIIRKCCVFWVCLKIQDKYQPHHFLWIFAWQAVLQEFDQKGWFINRFCLFSFTISWLSKFVAIFWQLPRIAQTSVIQWLHGGHTLKHLWMPVYHTTWCWDYTTPNSVRLQHIRLPARTHHSNSDPKTCRNPPS